MKPLIRRLRLQLSLILAGMAVHSAGMAQSSSHDAAPLDEPPLEIAIGSEWRVRDMLAFSEQKKLADRVLSLAVSSDPSEKRIAARAMIELGVDWFTYYSLANQDGKLALKFEDFFESKSSEDKPHRPLCAHLLLKGLFPGEEGVERRSQITAIIELLVEDIAERGDNSRARGAIHLLCDLNLNIPRSSDRETLLKAWRESEVYKNLRKQQ